MDPSSPGVLRERVLARRLREVGLRATRPRLLVLDILERLGGHRSVDEVVAALRAQGTALPRATVYNVVNALVERGLIMGADAGPGRALFEASSTWHHHFVCRSCGAVIDVPCVVGAKPCLQLDLAGAEVDEAQVIWRGRCPACAAGRDRGAAR
ncbi:MAG TPA: Fur family transcriptional regulator [Chloroflexota bacterium]|jgi:Fur family ferric uptake transcriptional regulator